MLPSGFLISCASCAAAEPTAASDSLRQRPRADQRSVHGLVQESEHPTALHPTGQARSERLHRALQPDLSRGGAQCLPVRLARRSTRAHRGMARAVQRDQTARRAGKPAASALPRALARSGNSSLELSTRRGSLRMVLHRTRRSELDA